MFTIVFKWTEMRKRGGMTKKTTVELLSIGHLLGETV